MITVTQADSIAPGNPFLSDEYNMGTQIGTNVMVMMGNHRDHECTYLYVVNTETGERIRVEFTGEVEKQEPEFKFYLGWISGLDPNGKIERIDSSGFNSISEAPFRRRVFSDIVIDADNNIVTDIDWRFDYEKKRETLWSSQVYLNALKKKGIQK